MICSRFLPHHMGAPSLSTPTFSSRSPFRALRSCLPLDRFPSASALLFRLDFPRHNLVTSTRRLVPHVNHPAFLRVRSGVKDKAREEEGEAPAEEGEG